ncbi:serine type site-specific recombinase [Youhaiella tibetensis]|nr:serine type site-specific recombinase [Youhaiella tibetensis]
MSDEAECLECVIYCRVSHVRQKTEGQGLVGQETRCREYAASLGLTVVAVFSDDMTGKVAGRQGMDEMLAFLKKNKRRHLTVVWDAVSRLARNREVYWLLRRAITELGCKIASPGMQYGNDAASDFREGIQVEFSQYESRENAERTVNRMKARLQNGYAVFAAPAGYRYRPMPGEGKMLERVEPAASIVREALQGYADGRFETQADVMRFLQDNPLFPKDATGVVRHSRVSQMLANCLYAGYVESPKWKIPQTKGRHDALISFETFTRIQARMSGATYTPRRRNLDEDFPLRGFVLCADCGTPLTACWTKGADRRHPYYLCPKRGCDSYGKSIRRQRIEGDFETLLKSVTPHAAVFRVARRIFKDLWDLRIASTETEAESLRKEMKAIDQEVARTLDKILVVSLPAVIKAFEDQVEELQAKRRLIAEKLQNVGRPKLSFEETLRTALDFISNPWILWSSGRLEDRRMVMKLVFGDRPKYHRKDGVRTPTLSLPFKVLGNVLSVGNGVSGEMARPKRFELLTPRFVVWCSIQLSYGRAGRFHGRSRRAIALRRESGATHTWGLFGLQAPFVTKMTRRRIGARGSRRGNQESRAVAGRMMSKRAPCG